MKSWRRFVKIKHTRNHEINTLESCGDNHLPGLKHNRVVFQVLIQESGERRVIAVGTVFENYNCHMMPGWLDGIVGYHVDDGKIFARGCEDLGREVEGNT